MKHIRVIDVVFYYKVNASKKSVFIRGKVCMPYYNIVPVQELSDKQYW